MDIADVTETASSDEPVLQQLGSILRLIGVVALIIGCLTAGALMQQFLSLPMPGSIIGIGLLFVARLF